MYIEWIFHQDRTTTIANEKEYTTPIISSEIGTHTEIKHLKNNQNFTYLGYTSRLDEDQIRKYIIYFNKTTTNILTNSAVNHI